MKSPADLKYMKSHEWVRVEGNEAVIGITDYAQEQLGDITFADMPAEGTALAAGKDFGALESVKAASDLYSPAKGTVVAVNADLETTPEIINQDPYGKGWMIRISLDELGADLMDAAAYDEYLKTV